MKKSPSFLTLAIASLMIAGFTFAADAKKETVVSKQAPCCAKAAAAGTTCEHACCIEAAKAGNNCEKCKGSGKIEKKVDAKK
jgi:hypothetical protein